MYSMSCEICKGYEYGICHIQCSELTTALDKILKDNKFRKILGLKEIKPRKWWKFYWDGIDGIYEE